jgi:hypothetical protein
VLAQAALLKYRGICQNARPNSGNTRPNISDLLLCLNPIRYENNYAQANHYFNAYKTRPAILVYIEGTPLPVGK